MLHPLLDKLVLAIEAARLMGESPVTIGSASLRTGKDLITSVYEKKVSITEIVDVFPDLIYTNLIQPFL